MTKAVLALLAFKIMTSSFLKAQEIPPKIKEEFETKVELTFKNRQSRDVNTVNLDGERISKGPISYLVIHFKMLVSNDEKRIRIIQGNSNKTRKIEVNEDIKLDVGFIEDVKSKQSPGQITLILLTDKKVPVSSVLLSIEEDGTFLVNGIRRGKF